MANRKINELSPRTPSLTDLMIVGDPSTGYSFKATLAALNTLIDSSTSIGDLNGVVITSPTNGQALVYDGTNWVNQSISVPVTSVFGRTGAVVATEGDYTLTQLGDVTLTSPSSNQVLQYNGTAWVNATLTDNGITSLNGLTALSQTFATGSSGTDFSITSTTSTHTFNLPTASAVNRGALSSADWSTFNSKVGGSGTSGQVAYWTGTSSQSGSNNLFWDNTNGRLGIGTNAPSYRLHNVGSSGFDNGNSNDAITILNSGFIQMASTRLRGFASAFQFQDNSFNTKVVLSMSGSISYFNTGGNYHFGGTTDGGQRLQVTGDVLFKGSGNTSGTTALTVQNSDGTSVLRVRNDNRVFVTQLAFGTDYPEIYSTATGAYDVSGGSLSFNASQTNYGVASYNFYFRHVYSGKVNTSGTSGGILQTLGFSPTSGTGIFNQVALAGAINQTGGANGITRGLYVNPTLTAAADWRSIEWSNNSGWGLYGTGTANNYLAGSLGIGTISLNNSNIRIAKTITGATSVNSIISESPITSTVTNTASIFASTSTTQNATFTLTNLRHFIAAPDAKGASSTITNEYGFVAASSLTNGTNNYGFYGDIPSATGRWNLYMNGTAANYMNGNLLLGSTVDGGQKLQVTGNAIVTGSGNTSATTAFSVRNSTPSTMMSISNDAANATLNITGSNYGMLQVNQTTANRNAYFASVSTGAEFNVGSAITNYTFLNTGGNGLMKINTAPFPTTGGDVVEIPRIGTSFAPTSGSAGATMLLVRPTINQTGGANGITIGINVNPILTAAADWRSIQWSNNTGFGLYGSGTSTNYLGGTLGIGTTSPNASAILQADSTTKGMLPPRMTNAQMVAIVTPASGLMVYDTTNNKLNVYDGTNWVAVH